MSWGDRSRISGEAAAVETGAETAGLERFRQSAGRGCPTSAGLLLPFRSSCLMVDREGFRFAEKWL